MKDFIFQEVCENYEVLDSSNSFAKKKIESGESLKNIFIISAGTQTNGRGRIERKWESSEKGNIYMTISINENLILENIRKILPLYVSFAILYAIKSPSVKYKWPNDVIIEGRKFCGVLIEYFKGFYIIGVGVNIVSSPENALFPATHLNKYNLNVTCEGIFNSLKESLEKSPSFIINFLESKFFSKENIEVNQGEFRGKFHGINNDGNLILALENGGSKKVITFGDVGLII
jgi:BirA family biotin operon repressor/biotin-[acetyl-CoA-carboxylase] ligase